MSITAKVVKTNKTIQCGLNDRRDKPPSPSVVCVY